MTRHPRDEDASFPDVRRSAEELLGATTPPVRPGNPVPQAESGNVDRRALLRLVSAALSASGLAACNPSSRFGAPLLSRPRSGETHARGETASFATSLELGGLARGALVQAVDGRPIRIEGNPLHPASRGATDVFMQAEVLSLYDPERSRQPRERGRERSWAHVRALLAAERDALKATGGRGLAVLAGPSASPTLARLLDAVTRALPEARVYRHGPVTSDAEHAGTARAFGRPLEAVPSLAGADCVLSLGADILGPGPQQVRAAADLAARRQRGRQSGQMPLLYAVEISPGLTGARADKRIVLRPGEIEPFARGIAMSLGLHGSVAGEPPAMAVRVAADLRAAGPRVLVLAGLDQPAAVHAIAGAINARLGAIGTTVRYVEPVLPPGAGGTGSIAALASAMASGAVSRLVILDGNPAYDAPADLGIAELIGRVPLSIHLGLMVDETARMCRWHLPARHVLESWGDTRAFDGTAGLQQPATAPLVESLSPLELLSRLAGGPADGHAIVQAAWRERWQADFDARWLRALEDGVVAGSEASPAEARLREDWDPGPTPDASAGGGLAIHFCPDPSIWDGRFAANAWLQELPRPLSKQAWGNAALIAPATALARGLATGDVIVIEAGDRRLEAPVWIMPGQAADTLTLPLGHGRTAAGRIGSGVGFDAYRLRTAGRPWHLPGAQAIPAGRRAALVSTQHHHVMSGRDIVQVVATGQPARATAPGRRQSLYPKYAYDGHAWGMSIDLDACIGCNACVIACQAENNVPAVGPEEVAAGREMHWLRIDRYYAGEAGSPDTYFQPILCMHCEKAPCEVVCPVNATVHSSEGLNDMVYNRCIGTRTCSNNCPYKVRRFNWLDYTSPPFGTPVALNNPDVTVRDRGVMEKCTYCTQRIWAVRTAARVDGRPIRDGEIMTACQQACPTRAIVFGDINDASSAVSRAKADGRNYQLLGELNTQPRTTYLARVRAARTSADDA